MATKYQANMPSSKCTPKQKAREYNTDKQGLRAACGEFELPFGLQMSMRLAQNTGRAMLCRAGAKVDYPGEPTGLAA